MAWRWREHHCFSQGIPFPSPSIFTPGQLARKYFASAHDFICEQYCRPSHLAPLDTLGGAGETLSGADAAAAARRRFSSAFSS